MLYQVQYASINDTACQGFQQFDMRNAPKVIRKVSVNDVRATTKQYFFHLDDRLLGITARTVGELL